MKTTSPTLKHVRLGHRYADFEQTLSQAYFLNRGRLCQFLSTFRSRIVSNGRKCIVRNMWEKILGLDRSNAIVRAIIALFVSTFAWSEAAAQLTLPPIELPDRKPSEITDPLKDILEDRHLDLLEPDWKIATIRCRGDSGFPISLSQKNEEVGLRPADRQPWIIRFNFVPMLEGYNRRSLKNGECGLPDEPIYGRSFTPPPGEPIYKISYIIPEVRNRSVRKINFDERGQFYTSEFIADRLIDLFRKNQYLDVSSGRRVVKSARFFDLKDIKEPEDRSLISRGVSIWANPQNNIVFAREGAAKYNLYVMEIAEIHDE